MKRFLPFLMIALIFVGCSSDDDNDGGDNGEVEVLSTSKETQGVLGGYVYRYTVSLKNTYDSQKSGKVVFKYVNGNTITYDFVNDVSIAAGQTQSFTGEWNNVVHQTTTDTASEVYFE